MTAQRMRSTSHSGETGETNVMEYRELGKTGLKLSVIGFGASSLGQEFRQVDVGEALACVPAALDVGINLIDTSPYYGRGMSEVLLGVALHGLWNRRQSTKFNGVSYPVQRAAEASYTPEGKAAVRGLIAFYLENAAIMHERLAACSYTIFGGVNAPYLWLRTPAGYDSWGFFDHLLQNAHVVGTPGSGFGATGEGFFRLSAFNQRDAVEEAMDRISRLK